MKQSELDCSFKNNLVHLLMLAVSAVGSTKDRAVISGETNPQNLTRVVAGKNCLLCCSSSRSPCAQVNSD